MRESLHGSDRMSGSEDKAEQDGGVHRVGSERLLEHIKELVLPTFNTGLWLPF